MMNEKKVMRMNEITEWAEEYGLTVYEAVYEMLSLHFETAGFWTDKLEKELSSKSEAELVELYCQI